MKTQVFLAFNRSGLVKATKGRSSLARDEIGVLVNVTIPDNSFRSPTIVADLNVPDHAVAVPEIEMDVVGA